MEYTKEDLIDLIGMQKMRVQDEADLLEFYENKLMEFYAKESIEEMENK